MATGRQTTYLASSQQISEQTVQTRMSTLPSSLRIVLWKHISFCTQKITNCHRKRVNLKSLGGAAAGMRELIKKQPREIEITKQFDFINFGVGGDSDEVKYFQARVIYKY